jgi:tetratricopeptide (TPR) repeat protein
MTPTTWRSRPIFITSTFRDMQAERDWLHSHVFPDLAERLRERFHHLETIDLRWGIDSAAADEERREATVLTVCLREIERSRPFLIGLLGDRYGWQPPAACIGDAAREAGLSGNVAGKSVTELEILYGVLRNEDQQRRSWFYLRDPLPYDAMPTDVASRYSDLHSGEPNAEESARKLVELKSRLSDALPGRVRRYTATWHPDKQAVTGLQVWGRQVLDDLWADLEAATAAYLRQAPRTWQEQERWMLEEFIEGRVRDFVGRTAVTNELVALATSGPTDDGQRGVCITAEPGAGKSSLFGHLYRSLQNADALVLAHAAGISVRSTQVDWMLHYWVGQLAQHLGQSDPLPEQATPNEVDRTFSRLLHQTAQQRRVVILIDALNQFEPTTRGTHLTWLPKSWPTNARLIATAIPDVQSEALRKRPGFAEVPLLPLVYEEGLEIVRRICGRYHRALNENVETALLAKERADGASAFGNALWLQLATEELNLLGSETFERVEEGSGAQGVVRLLTSVVEQMPSDVEGLYRWMLDRSDRHFGKAWTRAFVDVIAVSRGGWRESDLRELMPALSGEPWDPLRFAALRRAFRAHVVQRGSDAQWDFTHSQMRTAVEQRLTREGVSTSSLNRAVADHLLQLPREDRLHQTETMVHLMGESTLERAAMYFGSDMTENEARGATAVLASQVITDRAADVFSLLDQPVDSVVRGRMGERFLFELDDAIAESARVNVRGRLAESARRAFAEITSADPHNARWWRDFSVSWRRKGDVMKAQGNLPAALACFQASLAIEEPIASADPGNVRGQRDLSMSHERIGDVLNQQGNLKGALAAFQATLAIREQLAVLDPRGADTLSSLGATQDRIGSVLEKQGNLAGALAAFEASLLLRERLVTAAPNDARWQHDLSVSHNHIGNLLIEQGNLVGALSAFETSVGIRERLAAADPGKVGWQSSLAESHELVGDVLAAQGNLPGALAAYRAGLPIRERLTAADPDHTGWQRRLSSAYDGISDALTEQGNSTEALAAARASLAILQRLAATDPSDAHCQRSISIAHGRIGRLLTSLGKLPDALAGYEASRAIIESLLEREPGNALLQRDIAVCQGEIGRVLWRQGNLQGALAAYRERHRILERLAAADLTNSSWQRDVAASAGSIGHLLEAQGDLRGALAAYQSTHQILERLAQGDPTNAGWQRDLSLGHSDIGDVLRKLGSLSGALTAFQTSLAIRERLAAADPSNSGWQHELTVIWDRIGDVLSAQGNMAGAIAAFQTSFAIVERLSNTDPDNPEWQRDLSVGHTKIGDVLMAEGNLPGALAAFQTSLAIAERLAAADPSNARPQRDLAFLYSKLATYYDRTRDPKFSDSRRRCHELLRRMKSSGVFLDSTLVQLLEQLDRGDIIV